MKTTQGRKLSFCTPRIPLTHSSLEPTYTHSIYVDSLASEGGNSCVRHIYAERAKMLVLWISKLADGVDLEALIARSAAIPMCGDYSTPTSQYRITAPVGKPFNSLVPWLLSLQLQKLKIADALYNTGLGQHRAGTTEEVLFWSFCHGYESWRKIISLFCGSVITELKWSNGPTAALKKMQLLELWRLFDMPLMTARQIRLAWPTAAYNISGVAETIAELRRCGCGLWITVRLHAYRVQFKGWLGGKAGAYGVRELHTTARVIHAATLKLPALTGSRLILLPKPTLQCSTDIMQQQIQIHNPCQWDNNHRSPRQR